MLQQWPAIAPDLAPHTRAVGFDPDSGRLDLLPDSPAYAAQLRMSTAHLVAMANQAAGREAVRGIRVLPPGTHTATPATDVAPGVAPEPAGPVRTRDEVPDGYRQALTALQTAKQEQGNWLAPAVRAAIQRQNRVLRERREAEEESGDRRALLAVWSASGSAQEAPAVQQVHEFDARLKEGVTSLGQVGQHLLVPLGVRALPLRGTST